MTIRTSCMDQGVPTGIIELPPEWIRDDAVYYNFVRFSALRPYTPPSAVGEIFTAEFDGAWDEVRTVPADNASAHHRPSLPDAGAGAVDRAHESQGRCWFATHAQVAEWCHRGLGG